jgi:polyphosphate kinase
MIFCRGICSMKPINKNIEIRSLVGRFLEHSRIYSFYNDKKHDIFISSADLLTRNLDKRFELLVPVKHKETKSKLLKILSMYYTDTFNTFSMSSKGKYEKVKGNCNIHELFMKEAIENYKLKSIPKMIGIKKK